MEVGGMLSGVEGKDADNPIGVHRHYDIQHDPPNRKLPRRLSIYNSALLPSFRLGEARDSAGQLLLRFSATLNPRFACGIVNFS
jgi:hypothetical protein